MNLLLLEKPPRIAVFAPKTREPWDDAVRLVLGFANIDYKRIYIDEILSGELKRYDWLHLHHEDFTGELGRFYIVAEYKDWFIRDKEILSFYAKKYGFNTIEELLNRVAWKIREYVKGGGFLFAMCSATDTIDISLAFTGVDISPVEVDGTPIDPMANQKANFKPTFMFKNFRFIINPYIYEFSDIDVLPYELPVYRQDKFFYLKTFSASLDVIPTLLVQNHTRVIKDFLGQTTAFRMSKLKDRVIVLGFKRGGKWAKYIYTKFFNGGVTFYGGHDPEDYVHYLGDPPTDLSLYPTSPGYRLILNNIFLPAIKPKEKIT